MVRTSSDVKSQTKAIQVKPNQTTQEAFALLLVNTVFVCELWGVNYLIGVGDQPPQTLVRLVEAARWCT